MRKFTAVILAGLVIMASGCYYFMETYIGNYYFIKGFGDYRISDLGFVPFTLRDTQPDSEKIAENVNRIFMEQLERHNWYRVKVLTNEDLNDFNKLKQFDAVVTGEILYYKGVEPFKIGLTSRMKYISTGQTVWSSYFIFDGADKRSVNHLKAYYYNRQYPIHPMWGYQEILVSMNRFVEFACVKIIDTMRPGMGSHLMKRVTDESQVSGYDDSGILQTKNIDNDQLITTTEVIPGSKLDVSGRRMRVLQEDIDKAKQKSDITGRIL